MWPNPQETGDIVQFTKESLTGKLLFYADKQRRISNFVAQKMFFDFLSKVSVNWVLPNFSTVSVLASNRRVERGIGAGKSFEKLVTLTFNYFIMCSE